MKTGGTIQELREKGRISVTSPLIELSRDCTTQTGYVIAPERCCLYGTEDGIEELPGGVERISVQKEKWTLYRGSGNYMAIFTFRVLLIPLHRLTTGNKKNQYRRFHLKNDLPVGSGTGRSMFLVYIYWVIHQKSISLITRRTNMIKHKITSTVAHMTIPPFFWVLSACNFDAQYSQPEKEKSFHWPWGRERERESTFWSCFSPSSTAVATFWML